MSLQFYLILLWIHLSHVRNNPLPLIPAQRALFPFWFVYDIIKSYFLPLFWLISTRNTRKFTTFQLTNDFCHFFPCFRNFFAKTFVFLSAACPTGSPYRYLPSFLQRPLLFHRLFKHLKLSDRFILNILYHSLKRCRLNPFPENMVHRQIKIAPQVDEKKWVRFKLLQTLSRLLHFVVFFVKCWQEKESCCLVFPSSTKREFRHFHVVVVQRRQRNVRQSVIHVQSCCFANLNLLLFCRSRCRRRYLSSLLWIYFVNL